MASPITTGTGLGSGLDITSIVSALVTSDTIAETTQIKTQTADVTAKLSGVGILQAAMTAYQTALTNLGDTTKPPAFPAYASVSSNLTTLTTTSDGTAVPGTYSINVGNIATGSKIASLPFSGGSTSAIPTGTLTISQNGTAYPVDVPAGSTLQSVRDGINTALKDKGITANIVTDSSGSRLVMSSSTTGAGSDLTVSGIAGLEIDGTQPMTAASAGPPATAASAGYVGAKALDANLTIDGLAVASASNKVTAISGISMNLLATGTSTLNVSVNSTGLQTSLQTFVTAYNALMTTMNSLTAPGTADATTGVVSGGGALTGDSLARGIISSLRTVLVTPGPGSQLSVLSQLGIQTQQTDGTLSLDATKFASAVNDKNLGSQVQDLFTGTTSTNGLLARMGAVLTPYIQTGGVLASRTSSLNTQSSQLSTQQDNLDLRTTNLTAQLTAKYNAMDLIVGQLKATATSITAFFTSLDASKS